MTAFQYRNRYTLYCLQGVRRELHTSREGHGGEGLDVRYRCGGHFLHPDARFVRGVQLAHEVPEVNAHRAVVEDGELAAVELELRLEHSDRQTEAMLGQIATRLQQ